MTMSDILEEFSGRSSSNIWLW